MLPVKTSTTSPRTARKTITTALLIVNLVLLVLYSSGWTKSTNPTNPVKPGNKRTIVRRLSLLKYPVELSFKLKGQPLISSETVLPAEGIRTNEFEANADWLKDFTINVKNISGKTIIYTLVNVRFPEVVLNSSASLQQIFSGVDPDHAFARPELRLAPNESLEIPLAASYDYIRSLIRATGSSITVEELSTLDIEFHAARFDDNTLFEAGAWYRRNPDANDRNKWIVIEK